MSIKKFLTIAILACFSIGVMGQAKKPTIMVVPSEAWCKENNFTQTFDNQGTEEIIPDYNAAVSTDMQLNAVITKIQGLMSDRGFPLKDLAQAVKSINNNSAEDRVITSKKTGAAIVESPLDLLRRKAKADIIISLEWKVNQRGPKCSVGFTMKALDAYTDKTVATATGNGEESFSAELPVLLAEAVQDHMDAFTARMQEHFDDMMENGREVVLDMRVFDDGDIDFETEFDGYELNEVIDNWLAENCVKHRFNKSDATESMILYEQVRIPLYKDNGTAMDTYAFARNLARYLGAAPYNIPIKTINRGLGRCLVIIGEK